MSEATPLDEKHMARVLELARRGSYRVSPNPFVGCVIARGDTIIAEGFHPEYGEAHAERAALAKLDISEPLDDVTVYINLEPCTHHGKTPPCVEAILERGFKRVVVAQRDPNPKVDGRGLAILARSGVDVVVGVLEKEARKLNIAFNKFMITNRPLVIAKWAMSLDGKIASPTGDSKWITGPLARQRVHEVRGFCDAVVVGVGTALRDNPRLTRRDVEGRDPARVVIDSKARIDPRQVLVQTAKDQPTFLITTPEAPDVRIQKLRKLGVNIIKVPCEGRKADLRSMLDQFGRRGWQRILVEGGGTLLGSFFAHDIVDRVMCFVAPKIIGGDAAPTPAGGPGVSKIADALQCAPLTIEPLGDDVLLTCDLHQW